MGKRWINYDAVEWVLYEADVDAEQFSVLLAVASFTNAQGRGAYPARSLVALITRRSRSKVIRDLAELVKQGHLLTGDWRLVAHIRPDRRPNVYDLPDKYRTWIARGVSTTPREPVDNQPRGVSTAPREPSRGVSTDTYGVSGTTERGVSVTPKEFLKNSGKGARSDAQPSAASPTPPQPHAGDRAPRCRDCGNGTDTAYHRNVCQRYGEAS